MSKRQPETVGLTRVGDFELLKSLAKEVQPVTRQEAGILTAAVEAQSQPSDEDLTYMARELVQCTLRHSDPGQVPFWTRRNGNRTLSIVSDFDPQTGTRSHIGPKCLRPCASERGATAFSMTICTVWPSKA